MKRIFQWMMGLFLVCLSWDLQGVTFTMQDLGTLTAAESCAYGINNQNRVVGSIKDGDKVDHHFIWQLDKGLTLLPFPPTYQIPLMNHCNQITGLFWHQTNYWFSKNKTTKHLYIFDSDGSFQDIDAPKQWKIQELKSWQTPSLWDEKELNILSFNDHGQILLANSHDSSKATQFAVWQNGDFQEIDLHFITTAYRMNNQGLILGRKWIKKENHSIPMLVLYNSTEGTVIEIMKDMNLIRRELNDRGQVIVLQALKNQETCQGFLWDPEQGLIQLEDFAPLAMNNCHQIVGFQISEIQNKKNVPLLWNQGEIIPLSSAVDQFLWSEIGFLTGINDNGYIIGQGQFDGKKHAFLLIPSVE